MFDNIFAAIEKWMRELLTGMVESNMSTMFTDVNEKTSEIAAQVGRTPQNWNSSVFSMIQNLSESVVVPIAGIIITLVLCYELISMLTERNNLHDVDTYSLFRCCWKQMVWQQEKTISLKEGMMPRKMQLSFHLKKINKVPSRLKSVQLDITSTWAYNTSKWT